MRRPVETQWIYGWTHFQTVDQTETRLHKSTHEIEVKDKGKWIKCRLRPVLHLKNQYNCFCFHELPSRFMSGKSRRNGFLCGTISGVAEISHAFAEMRQRQFSTSC